MSQIHQDNRNAFAHSERDDWEIADTIISNLSYWGISYLVGLEHQKPGAPVPVLSLRELIQELVHLHGDARIRDASIALFLLHPECTSAILDVLQEGEAEDVEQLATLVLATLYLQRKWSIRLTIAFGRLPRLSETPFAFLWQRRNLPPPECFHGEWGLLALQAFEQGRTGLPFAFIEDWQNQVEHLVWQEEQRHQPLSLSTGEMVVEVYDDHVTCEKEPCMSMRPNVDKRAIETFLQQLGRAYRKPGRLYLVGGAALVHAGVRPGFTQDIDIQVGGANEGELVVAIQRLIQQLQINIEFASPGDFIPLPSQWESHAQFVGRYGSIDVFYFDFYSIALSKIERASTRDIEDVKLLLQQQYITLSALDDAYQSVLSQLGKGRYPRVTPEQFAARYAAIRALL